MNYKYTGLHILLIISILCVYHFVFFKKNQHSYVYLDSKKILTEYSGMIDVNAFIKRKESDLKSSLDTLSLELQMDIKNYEKNRSALSDNECKTREELIARKQQQFFQYKLSVEEKAKNENQKIISSELEKVNKMIAEFGALNNYTIIFGTNNGNIVYADESIDISDEVLKYINSKYVPLK